MIDVLEQALLPYDSLARTLECDVVIIGSGAGGSAAAAVLCDAGLSVLMLEEGPFLTADRVPDSATGSFRAMWRNCGLTAALGKPPISYAEGRCVGGSTEINSAIYQETPADLIEKWATAYSLRDFSPDSLRPHFDATARAVNASQTPDPLGRASDILKDGGDRLGWKTTRLDRAQRSCVGTNLCSFGCPTGGKQSMTQSLLPRAAMAGLRIIADCRVQKITTRGYRAATVEARVHTKDGHGKDLIVIPRLAVFAAAGAINTPALLQRSRMADHRIGTTLRLHPTVRVLAHFKDKVNAFDSRLPLYALSEFMPDQRIGGSVMSPAIFGMALAEDWLRRQALIAKADHCGTYYAMARAEGSGRVRTFPGLTDPIVTYGLTRRDWRLLTEGLARLVRVMFAAGATRVFPSIADHPGWASSGAALTELGELLSTSRTNLMTIHMFSSCRMGESDHCAVDSFGRLKGWDNLYIADASVVPAAPGVNPQGTVMALARRTAQAFLGQGPHHARAAAERG